MANSTINQDTGSILEHNQDYANYHICKKATVNEGGRLPQGMGGWIEGSNTIFFIHKCAVP
jgi:hypothetical protein